MSRLKVFRKANKVSQGELAAYLGVTQGFVSQIEHDSRPLPDELLAKILANEGWDCSMLVETESPQVSISHFSHSTVVGQGQINLGGSQAPDEQQEEDLVPVIPVNLYKEADVNIKEYVMDEDNNVPMSPAVQQFPKTDLFYNVQTMAMYPHLHQGDILALKEVKKRSPIVNGELYAVDTVDLGILVRFIYDRGEQIELRGSEKADRFEPIFIDKADIYNIYRVVGLIRINI